MHYSLLITSCNRFDLLQQTLDSFIRISCGGIKPRECIIVDDSDQPMPEWLASNIHFYSSNLGVVKWVSNGRRRGQIYSADRLWSLCNNDYAFWMEDDWTWNEGNFMQESFDILEKHPKVITVSLRGNTGWHQLIDPPPYPFKVAMPGWKGGWGGFTFNCGVRRKSDYQKLGSYGLHVSYGTHGLVHERELSQLHLKQGRIIADLNRVIAVHIGGSRSRAIEPLPPLPKILIAVPVCHKFSYTRWESGDSPAFNKNNAYENRPYGTGIHISGDNNRVQALRDTWLKDVAAFPNATYKLFYGGSNGRTPLPDEVFLACPDDYAALPQKTLAICKYAVANGYDMVFKADDDSYVWVDRLIREGLSGLWDYAGYMNGQVASGGPGYWLTDRAFKIVAEKGSANHWAEDVTVSKILFGNGIQGTMLPNHHPGFSAHWFDITNIPAGSVCIHALQPDTMRELYAREHPSS